MTSPTASIWERVQTLEPLRENIIKHKGRWQSRRRGQTEEKNENYESTKFYCCRRGGRANKQLFELQKYKNVHLIFQSSTTSTSASTRHIRPYLSLDVLCFANHDHRKLDETTSHRIVTGQGPGCTLCSAQCQIWPRALARHETAWGIPWSDLEREQISWLTAFSAFSRLQ